MAARAPDDRPPPGPAPGAPERLHGADAVRLHATLAVGLAVCVAAFVIEVSRALGGNSLSWAYVFEWPIFAAFAIYMWWNLLHGTDGRRRRPGGRRASRSPDDAGPSGPVGSGDGPAGTDDPELRAWQEYLRAMEADEAGRAGRRPD